MTTSKEILEGVQALIRMWEAGRLPDDMTLAMIELHLEKEASLSLPIGYKESQSA